MFAPTCFGPLGPSSGSLFWTLLKLQFFVELISKNTSLYDLRCRTPHGTQYAHHSLKYLLPQHRKSYNDVFLPITSTKNCSFNKAQNKLTEDGPSGPKHVEANIKIF
jgi:hypothetical protein